MWKFSSVFKLNLFSSIYFLILLPLYIEVFVKNAGREINPAAKFTILLMIFLPILIIQIISIVKSSTIKFGDKRPKILLIFMAILFVVAPIVMLAAKKYFEKYFENTNNERTDVRIYRNTIINVIYLCLTLLFVIIYAIFDATLDPSKQIATKIFALAFVVSLIAVLFQYLLVVFYVINSVEFTRKQKGLLCIPIFNVFYFKKILNEKIKEQQEQELNTLIK